MVYPDGSPAPTRSFSAQIVRVFGCQLPGKEVCPLWAGYQYLRGLRKGLTTAHALLDYYYPGYKYRQVRQDPNPEMQRTIQQ